ncbi:hypothetical protein [Microbacterium flavescens]|uniref:hypothetical protein n=1 Tax=Microbacterium flavescens TaxID=69366 RepID=UPI0027DC5D60|nr:hypothetical protein [Microbacterium flavescens]BFF09622.1 hypothetical protein GCM10025699_09250 [Microbacterium flavescens]
MEIATSQLPRIWRLALIGAATAFAWIVLSLLLGLGYGSAHAAEGYDDGKGLLGAVTSAVDRTAASVTSTVTKTTSTVTEVVNTVVDVAPAPVQQPVREVVKTVGTVVNTVAEPVVQVVSNDAVSTITKPVVEVVTQVPVVGGIVSGTGLDDAVGDLAETVDDTVDGVTGAVTDTGEAIGQPSTGGEPSTGTPELPPVSPGTPVLPGSGSTDGSPAPSTTDVSVTTLPGLSADQIMTVDGGWGAASALPFFEAAYEPGSAPSDTVSPSTASSDARGHLTPAGALCPPNASSSGSGGAGPGAWALVALGPLAALRAWVRRAGPEDEHAPPAPAGSTDVSPD